MYKYLLAWRYLRSRHIALVSIISVTLGVATMIVVNSVMSGFSTEMKSLIHGISADVVVKSGSLDGFPNPEGQMEKIRKVAGDQIEAMTATVTVPAMLTFEYKGQTITNPVQLVGIDEATYGQVCEFGNYLQHPENRNQLSFQLREDGYDTIDHQSDPDRPSPERTQMKPAGWGRRRTISRLNAEWDRLEENRRQQKAARVAKRSKTAPMPESNAQLKVDALPLPDILTKKAPADDKPSVTPEQSKASDGQVTDLFANAKNSSAGRTFDMATEQHTGAVLGFAMVSRRDNDGRDRFAIIPGHDVTLTYPTAGKRPDGQSATFTVIDLYESKMSEYDARLVFVPIGKLQQLRGMIDPESGMSYATQIQLKVRDGVDLDSVRDQLRAVFPTMIFNVFTWRDRQHALLSAVEIEIAILNILLFLIIAVAGFGILAIFLMIVVEKTRDIGILKALGASRSGVMGIFVGYGLSLGLVGSGTGTLLGLWLTNHINEVADWLSKIKGEPIFNPEIYYFYKIPTIIDPFTISWIVAGAVGIAVLSSVLPALRAATLHPVKALRYE
jgi:lipoprotein-releasing system permease protein